MAISSGRAVIATSAVPIGAAGVLTVLTHLLAPATARGLVPVCPGLRPEESPLGEWEIGQDQSTPTDGLRPWR